MVNTIVPGVGITDTAWMTNWTPTVIGTVTVAAALTDTLGNTITDTIQLLVEAGNPTAITLQTWDVHPVTTSPLALPFAGLLTLATIVWWRRKRQEE